MARIDLNLCKDGAQILSVIVPKLFEKQSSEDRSWGFVHQLQARTWSNKNLESSRVLNSLMLWKSCNIYSFEIMKNLVSNRKKKKNVGQISTLSWILNCKVGKRTENKTSEVIRQNDIQRLRQKQSSLPVCCILTLSNNAMIKK